MRILAHVASADPDVPTNDLPGVISPRANPSPRTGNASSAGQDRLVAALADPAVHGPGCASVRVLETHISYVLLTGVHAYKLKKAVNLGFLDFTTLAARRHFCEQELRLNRRLAPALYLDVIAITGTPGAPVLGGSGPVLEYAVKMREFSQHALASEVLARDELAPHDIDALAARVADFHAAIAGGVPPPACGTPESILEIALANFDHIGSAMAAPEGQAALAQLESWTRREHAALAPVFRARRAQGFVRECHGDLHLRNIAVLPGEVVIFDCIEFNDAMRWIDVQSEIAFTVMDLHERGHACLAHRFLNAYLERTGDYAGLPVLRFYLVYRALVRAKIVQLRVVQLSSADDPAALLRERDGYLRLAQACARASAPALIITHGFSGCGKTALSGMLLEHIGAVRIRTDLERKRRLGVPAMLHTEGVGADALYSADTTRQTYDYVRQLAASVAAAGLVTIIDGAFLQRWQRETFRDLAAELQIPFVVLAFTASNATLQRRIVERNLRGTDASDADVAVLDLQLHTCDELAADEQSWTVHYDAETPLALGRSPQSWAGILERLGLAVPAGPADRRPPAQ